MSTYYEILGIPEGAGTSEIKGAFRRLAKLYHPDKNPSDKERFAQILRAYETLVDPSQRAAYDRKLQYQRGSGTQREPGSKHWSFEEREQKRRKYYEEHIKKYEKARPVYEREATSKNNYNEFKYILFATPLAVALLLLVIRLASSPEDLQQKAPPLPLEKRAKKAKVLPPVPESPYAEIFGEAAHEIKNKKSMAVSNGMGLDVVLCIFKRGHFLRSNFLAEDTTVLIPQLPKGPYQLRLIMGHQFNAEKKQVKSGALGSFEKSQAFYCSKSSVNLDSVNFLNLDRVFYRNLVEVTEDDFFARAK